MNAATEVMNASQFAARIGKSKSWVYENSRVLQHRRNGANLHFTEEDVQWYLESIKVTPGSGRTRQRRKP